MADSHRFHPRKVKCLDTGEIFHSMYAAGKSIGKGSSSIYDCCLRNQRENTTRFTAGGYHFVLAEDENEK